MSERAKDEIGTTYTAAQRYLALPETKEVRADMNTYSRRRDGVDIWQMVKRFVILLIKTCIIEDQKRKIKGIHQF